MLVARKREKLSRKEREHLFRRKNMLDAALKLFAAKGYEGTSMQEISALSEFSIGTLYNFFSTKEELYLTLIEEKFRESHQWIKERVSRRTGSLARVEAAVEALLTFMENNREFFNLFLSIHLLPDRSKVNKGIYQKIIKYYEKHIEYFCGLMKECVREGVLKDYEPSELAMALIGITNEWIYNWLKGPDDKNLREQHKRIVELFLNGAGRSPGKGRKLINA